MEIKCPICNQIVIWVRNERGFVKTPQYFEIELYLTNETLCTVAVCKGCADGKPTTDRKIIKWLKDEWRREMVGWASDKQFSKMESLEILASGNDRLNVESEGKSKRKHGIK